MICLILLRDLLNACTCCTLAFLKKDFAAVTDEQAITLGTKQNIVVPLHVDNRYRGGGEPAFGIVVAPVEGNCALPASGHCNLQLLEDQGDR